MTKEEALARLKAEMAKPCELCVDKVFQFYMDPETQGLLCAWAPGREGLLQFHVHPPGVLDPQGKDPVMLLRTLVYVAADVAILHWVPSSRTIEGAFANLEEVLRQERLRLTRPREHGLEIKRRAGTRREG